MGTIIYLKRVRYRYCLPAFTHTLQSPCRQYNLWFGICTPGHTEAAPGKCRVTMSDLIPEFAEEYAKVN